VRRVNPHFDIPDARLEAGIRAERPVTRWLRAGLAAQTARVDFAGATDRHDSLSADLVVDTRLDPSFPRNAVHLTTRLERLAFEGGHAGRWLADLRGYAGLIGSTVLAVRGNVSLAGAPLPASEQPLLGGSGSLRGYRAGHRAGDNLAALSAELRVPVNSPLSAGRLGVKVFVDSGTTWAAGRRLADQHFDRGIGGGVYFGLAALLADLDVAWPESGKLRVHFGLGVTF
jgi:outer membrane protein assembly factor BamA